MNVPEPDAKSIFGEALGLTDPGQPVSAEVLRQINNALKLQSKAGALNPPAGQRNL
jgi:hypothetical protein